MNERTLELYKLAHVPHTDIDPSNNMPYETTIFSAEKFAELIIRECIDLLNPEGDPYTSLREDYGRSLSMNMIKKHFGVE